MSQFRSLLIEKQCVCPSLLAQLLTTNCVPKLGTNRMYKGWSILQEIVGNRGSWEFAIRHRPVDHRRIIDLISTTSFVRSWSIDLIDDMSTTRESLGKKSFLISRARFFSKIAVRKISTSSKETSRRDPDCNLFECHLRFSLPIPMRLNSLRFRAVRFSSRKIFLWKILRKFESGSSRYRYVVSE